MSDKLTVSNKLPGKQVSILAHRKKRILQVESQIDQRRKQRIARFAKKKRNFKTAETFIMQYRKAERTHKRAKQVIIRKNILKKEDKGNSDLLVVMRHAGLNIPDGSTRNILKSLRLSHRYYAVFLRNTEESQVLLKLVEPFVVYGYPTITTVRELIFKKGFAKINGRKTAITSNTMIEEHLGENGIICLEDIIHEISKVGPNFDMVNDFLCPFTLKAPRNGWKNKVSISKKRGGEYGNHENEINPLIAKCL